jgi:hypothetical protein
MMKKFAFILNIAAFVALPVTTQAQAPIDCFYPGKGNGAIALSASFESYSQFFLGDGSMANWADDYNVTSYSLYGTYGITDKFAAALSLPYISIKTKNFNGENVNRSDLQDIGLYFKYLAYEKKFDGWKIALSPAVGVSTPLTNYTVDFYGVGQGATAFDVRGIAMFATDLGFFGEVQGAGILRLAPAPSGSSINIKAGYYNAKVYADVFYAIQSIPGGADLPDPENFKALGVSYQKIGGTVAYNISEAIGIYAGGAYVLDGRSVGQSTRYSGGAVWRF